VRFSRSLFLKTDIIKFNIKHLRKKWGEDFFINEDFLKITRKAIKIQHNLYKFTALITALKTKIHCFKLTMNFLRLVSSMVDQA